MICCAIEGARADALLLPDMVAKNEDAKCTAFTVSTDLKEGITTGAPENTRLVHLFDQFVPYVQVI